MKSIGSLYVDTIKLKHPLTPVFEWGWSQETEHPFRESSVCLVFWVPFINRGYAVGLWGEPVSEDQAYSKVFKETAMTDEVRPKQVFASDFDMDNVQIGDDTYKVVSRR